MSDARPSSDGHDVTTLVLVGITAASVVAAVIGELLLRVGVPVIPAPIAVVDGAVAMFTLAAAVIRAATVRSRRENSVISKALERAAWGAGVFYIGIGLASIAEEWAEPGLAAGVEAVSRVVALPLVVMGVYGLCWPPRMSKAQARVLLADAMVGSLGLVVLWALVIFPQARQNSDQPGLATVSAAAMLVASVLLLILIGASRRRTVLPARQLWMIHGAIAVHLLAGVIEIAFASGGVTAVPVAIIGYVVGGGLFVLFSIQPSVQAETPAESRARELYASLVPLLPIPVASLALVATLVGDDTPPGPPQVLGGILLILLLIGVVVLRALASAELRRAARQREGAGLSMSTEEEWFQVLVGRTQDLTLVLHRDGTILYATPSVHRATGIGPDDMRGRLFASLLTPTPANETAVRELMTAADVRAGAPTDAEDLLLQGPGAGGREAEWRFTALVGLDIDGYLVHGRDVTDERRMSALLAQSATRDTLTGLHNRAGFLASTSERAGKRCVLVVNLRRFADLNDQFGHPMGDRVLRHVAEVLRDLPGPVSEPARLSADTFAVLVTGAVPDIEVVAAAASIREALGMFSLPDGRLLPLDVAAGYAVSEADDMQMGELLGRAEYAMARSRSLDRSPLVRFDPTLRLERDAAVTAEADLRSALRERSLVVRYQPIVRLTDGAVVAVEALVRRMRADGSLESPDVFIPLAEQLGLVDEVDYAVLRRSLSEMAELAALTRRRLPVSVNISASELDDGLEHRVLDALSEANWRPEHLVVEVTETALAARTDEASRLLRRLRTHGCRVAIDDFGTGYSSMASLVEMPVDILKIDASFVHRIAAGGRSLSVMRAIVEIGRSLNLKTVAEGLTTVEQADLLRGMGCDRGQGYLYAPPLSMEDLIDYLRPDQALMVME